MNMNEEQLSEMNIDIVNQNLVETNVKFIGDRTAISQVVQLLAYIRHAIKNNQQQTISVKIGHNVVNIPFEFSVNNQEIKDFVAKDNMEIN